ncbi:MAG: hypothetical protein HQ522_08920 [Bacteroidetes bacterium]|nr:hypothetical protein [Bacteroidota bacterium]
MTLILIVSVIGFTTGFYLKFIKSYTDEKLPINATNYVGESIQRQPKLSETIAFLEKLETITDSNKIINKENDNTLKRLKTINLISIIAMIISIVLAIGSTQKLLTKKNN